VAEIGGGYLEGLEEGFIYGQLRGTIYENADTRHTLFGELMYFGEDTDVALFFRDGTSGIFDGSTNFFNLSLGYEAAFKLTEGFELYAGGSAGAQFVSLDLDRFSSFNDTLDDDVRFVGQAFAGMRFHVNPNLSIKLGARRMFLEDFEVLGDEFSIADQWGFEAGLTFRF